MTSEADLIFARANVALAKSQRLIASWLPPRTEEELQNAKTNEEIEKEEEEMFKPMPEWLGLGATPKDEHDSVRKELSKDDVLRKRLLGKDFEKIFRQGAPNGKKGAAPQVVIPLGASKPMPVEMKRRFEDSDEEDEVGRSGLGRSKGNKKERFERALRGEGKDGESDGGDVEVPLREPAARVMKRPSSYLDQVLAEKQRKKKKRAKGKAGIK